MATLSTRNMTRQPVPRISFEAIAHHVLLKTYECSLVFIGDAKAKQLNIAHRNKTYRANVLTFPLSKESGEIFINLMAAKREAPSHGLSVKKFITLLFIHGCLHLKGMPHGDTMESTEHKLLSKFS